MTATSALIWLATALCSPKVHCDAYNRDVAGIGHADWIHIVWRGAQSRSMPIIWISHERLTDLRLPPEVNLVFSPAEYRRLAQLPVQNAKGLDRASVFDHPVPAFRVTRRVGYGKPITTYLNAPGGCRYLSSILRVSNVNWAAERKDVFLEFATTCEPIGMPLPSD